MRYLIIVIFCFGIIACDNSGKCKITGVSSVSARSDSAGVAENDTVDSELSFHVPLVLSCSDDADPAEADWENDVNLTTFSLTLNQKIILNSDTIPAGSNLITAIPQYVQLSRPARSVLSCLVTESLFQQSVFDSSLYTFQFTVSTTDGSVFQGTRNFYLR